MADSRSHDGTLRTLLIVLAIILVAPLLLMLVSFPMMGAYGGMMGGYGGHSPLWGIGMVLIPLVVLAVVAYLGYRALGGRQAVAASDPALEELRVAYARGELSDEEYQSRLENLREHPHDDRE